METSEGLFLNNVSSSIADDDRRGSGYGFDLIFLLDN